MWRKIFNWTVLSGTLFLIAIIWLLQIITTNLSFLDVVEEVLLDFQISDIYYSKIRDNAALAPDDRIVIINVGENFPAHMAALATLELLNEASPKVIGLNLDIAKPAPDEMIDSLLRLNIQKASNLVLSTDIETIKNTNPTQKATALHYYKDDAFIGFKDLGSNVKRNGFETSRFFSPFIPIEDTLIHSFALQITALYDREAAQNLKKRHDTQQQSAELINYRGNWDKFTVVDLDDMFQDFDPDLVRNKIVLIGTMGESFIDQTGSDRYYTPLNDSPIGRNNPDMYGIVVQANIISMILGSNYLIKVPSYFSIIIAIFFAYFNAAIFANWYFSSGYGTWYDVITKVFQLIEIIILVFLLLQALENFNLQIDLTFAIVVIALSGDLLEMYFSLLSNTVEKSSKYFQ
ncbi:MAG: CHASE2 domain-containing protein [Bernardetiaceae bacterium]|nr:CHASE2 domain-containing protein [Bernardetiaceae bacterium]